MIRYTTLLKVIVLTLLILAGCRSDTPDGALPWREGFSNQTEQWVLESDAIAEVEIKEGVLQISVGVPNQLAWATSEPTLTDFRLSVKATQAEGPDDNEYGVLVRMKDDDHFYRFGISGDGYYKVDRYDAGEWISLTEGWTQSNAINQGQQTNHLEVVCSGRDMTLTVNGSDLVTVTDSRYSKGHVGLYAGTFFEPGVTVHFDDLVVEPIDE